MRSRWSRDYFQRKIRSFLSFQEFAWISLGRTVWGLPHLQSLCRRNFQFFFKRTRAIYLFFFLIQILFGYGHLWPCFSSFWFSNSALQNRLQLLYVFAQCFYSGPDGTAFLPIFFAIATSLSFLPISPLLQMWFHGPSRSFAGSPPESLQVYLTNVACSDMLPMKTLVNIQCSMIKMIMYLWFIGFLSVSLHCTVR